jgi:hypothetical protein
MSRKEREKEIQQKGKKKASTLGREKKGRSSKASTLGKERGIQQRGDRDTPPRCIAIERREKE